jgi:hypothetical protein
MRFLFAYAGIPSAIFKSIQGALSELCGDDGEFVASPLYPSTSGSFRYSEKYSDYFLRGLSSRIEADDDNQLHDTGFALFYVTHDIETTSRFAEYFFPSTLAFPIEWSLDLRSDTLVRQSRNALMRALRVATNKARVGLPWLKKEVTEQANRTPLLLPVKNFRSDFLQDAIRALQSGLSKRSTEEREVIEQTVAQIRKRHPLEFQAPRSRFFADDREIRFCIPGRDRHAFARPGGEHPYSCVLSGRRRLGAPYDRAFHYDCSRGSGNLKAGFFGCHEPESMREGNPHLNIAPNDFVRC